MLTPAELKAQYLSFESVPYAERQAATTVYQLLQKTAVKHGQKDALSFHLSSNPCNKSETLSWRTLLEKVTQCANMLHHLGIRKNDVVAYLLPSQNETVISMLGAMTAGIVAPINPLLDAEQIASLLAETRAKVLVTLAPFPKTDLAQKAHRAAELCTELSHIIEIDLGYYLPRHFSLILPLLRPRLKRANGVETVNFHKQLALQNCDQLDFNECEEDRFCAYFHTGGTTGSPKIAQHRHSGIIYNGWISATILFATDDKILCPLPLFHVFAAYPIWLGCMHSGAHMIIPTPSGYRGEGVLDNFWKILEHWQCTAFITVPTAATMLTQRVVDADISNLSFVISGSAPFPKQQLEEFKAHIQANVLEGYGMTEATCLISCNPLNSIQKTGSVGAVMPYTDVKILRFDNENRVSKVCRSDEIGEICILSPGVNTGATYLESEKNINLYADSGHVRSGDLGRLDEDGYLWITGRAKDLIIRGGHNIDPAMIEDALAKHPAVSLVAAVGQPDRKSGEVPCAYVELVEGASVSERELYAFAEQHIPENAAVPKHIEILAELPKTAIGKLFKPALRELAVLRCYNAALLESGIHANAIDIAKDDRLGLVVIIRKDSSEVSEQTVQDILGDFTIPWRFSA